jgi:hypothetical protein
MRTEQDIVEEAMKRIVSAGSDRAAIAAAFEGTVKLVDIMLSEVRDLRVEVDVLNATQGTER